MTEQPNSETQNTFNNKTLAIASTALVACSNLLPSDISRKIAAASAPAVSIALAYIFKKCKNVLYMYIEQRRGVNVYKEIISYLNKKLSTCHNDKEQADIKKQISKYENDLHELKIKNIKSFI